ncbi:DBH-like monooxygenase protein 1 [Bulinus truncatus]|nr:DBH-like monooxygenase protein 1 [Bulinus truncatus]
MAGSDVIIGWVNNGKSFFADRHAKGHFQPALDASQDWFLICAKEAGEFTTLTFIRKLDTCDPDDRPITFTVPAVETFYRCKVFRLPELGQKHHLIRFEPAIQPGHEQLVHHIIVYYCPSSVHAKFDGASFECYDNVPAELFSCKSLFIGWAIGGQAFDFPPITGLPLGSPDDPKVLVMETHYNNPALRKDFVDNSGMEIILTKQLRQMDAGVLDVGFHVSDTHIIPPHEPNFLSTAHCPVNCIDKALGDQEIHIFAGLLHTHVIGKELKTRHFRNGSELAPIMEDSNYDFNYQEVRKLSEKRIVKKGDSLVQECVYDSTDRTNVTYGGLSTRSEMCLTFLLYYPKVKMTKCLSSILKTAYVPNTDDDVKQAMGKIDWTDPDIRQEFQRNVTNADIMHICWFDDISKTMAYPSKVPKYTNLYQPPRTCPI